ncbi:hypothetical protein H6F95_07960 [Cyanobacteria bacterium FACHB-471]|nr:hypothetical protein [Cyanobacteria bacterium FACHB-471]
MITTLLKPSNYTIGDTHGTGEVQVSNNVPATQSRKNRLVARWLVDENLKLYSQWVTED